MPETGRAQQDSTDPAATAHLHDGERITMDEIAVQLSAVAVWLRQLARAAAGQKQALRAWEDGLARTTGAPADPGLSDPLALAACLIYSSDLAFEERMATGASLRAVHDAYVPVGFFLLSGFMQQISGFYQLQVHRQAGIADRLGEGERVVCPFCGLGDYDQTIIGCDRCTADGGYARTFPAWWTGGDRLPARIAPDPLAARARSRRHHEQLAAQQQHTR